MGTKTDEALPTLDFFVFFSFKLQQSSYFDVVFSSLSCGLLCWLCSRYAIFCAR